MCLIKQDNLLIDTVLPSIRIEAGSYLLERGMRDVIDGKVLNNFQKGIYLEINLKIF